MHCSLKKNKRNNYEHMTFVKRRHHMQSFCSCNWWLLLFNSKRKCTVIYIKIQCCYLLDKFLVSRTGNTFGLTSFMKTERASGLWIHNSGNFDNYSCQISWNIFYFSLVILDLFECVIWAFIYSFNRKTRWAGVLFVLFNSVDWEKAAYKKKYQFVLI